MLTALKKSRRLPSIASGMLAAPAWAQTQHGRDRLLPGPDRMQRLIDGAKKEAIVSVYGSTVAEDMNPIIDAFKKQYGIDFQYWRRQLRKPGAANGGREPRRPLHGRCFARSRPSSRRCIARSCYRPSRRRSPPLMPQALRPHGEWVASRLNIFSAAYNTDLVKKDELPKSYEDLKDPRWRGRLAVEADDSDWFATIVTKMGADKGVQLFKDIVRTNGLSIRKGHTLLSNLVAAGEVPLALTVYSYKPEQQQRAGAPVAPLYLAPVVALGYGPAVARCAPHPHAARAIQRIHAERRHGDLCQARHGGD